MKQSFAVQRVVKRSPYRQRSSILQYSLINCKLLECAEPLGMASGVIPDSDIQASSFKVGGEPWRARLGSGSGWTPSSVASSEYIVVDLGESKAITYIEMEGDSLKNHWLKYFFLDYRMSTRDPWTIYEPRGISGVNISP